MLFLINLLIICGKYVRSIGFLKCINSIIRYFIPHNTDYCGKVWESRPILLY